MNYGLTDDQSKLQSANWNYHSRTPQEEKSSLNQIKHLCEKTGFSKNKVYETIKQMKAMKPKRW